MKEFEPFDIEKLFGNLEDEGFDPAKFLSGLQEISETIDKPLRKH